jgi:hypothetical protein
MAGFDPVTGVMSLMSSRRIGLRRIPAIFSSSLTDLTWILRSSGRRSSTTSASTDIRFDIILILGACVPVYKGLRVQQDTYKRLGTLMPKCKGTDVARWHVIISDELDRKFRMKVLEEYGSEKGALSKAVAEAIELWLKQAGPPAKKK